MLFQLTKDLQEKLTKNEKNLIEYICRNQQNIAFMSIKEIAKKTNISESTISRFSKHMGFINFKDMKQYIFENTVSPTTKISSTITQNSNVYKFLSSQNDYIKKL